MGGGCAVVLANLREPAGKTEREGGELASSVRWRAQADDVCHGIIDGVEAWHRALASFTWNTGESWLRKAIV